MNALDARGCRRERRRLLRYVDGELDAAARLAFEDHVADCASCEAALAMHLRIEELLHLDAGVEPDPGFDDRIVRGLRERIDRHDVHDLHQETERAPADARPATTPRSARPAAAALGVAGLATVVTALALVPRPPRGDAPDRGAATTAAPAEAQLPALPSPDDVLVPALLAAARATVDHALRAAEDADDYRAAFTLRTEALRAEAWPVGEIVIKAIADDDAGAARRAIRAAHELALDDAVPALRRAARRGETAGEALVALGALRDDRSLDRLSRGLADPALREAAADGLVRLGSADAARRVGDLLGDPALEEIAASILLGMGTTGVGELLRRREAGDAGAACVLFEAGRPTPDETLRLLDPSAGDEPVAAAALSEAAAAGPAALPHLAGLLRRPRLARPAADAMVRIGGAGALLHLSTAPPPADGAWAPGAFDALVDGTIRRVVEADPTIAAGVADVVRGAAGDRIVRALDARSPESAAVLEAAFADSGAPADRRARAAVALAAAGSFDGTAGLAAVFELAMVDEDAAADVLCAAVLARAGPPDPAALAPFSRPVADRLLRRARVVADRWADDGEPPQPWERRGLAKLLSRAVPKL